MNLRFWTKIILIIRDLCYLNCDRLHMFLSFGDRVGGLILPLRSIILCVFISDIDLLIKFDTIPSHTTNYFKTNNLV